jgi:putative endonuclease
VDKRSKGAAGEELAVRYLKKRRYKILCRNFRTKSGEIDIIASKNNATVFIEVKLRNSASFGYPYEAVDKTKATHLQKTALAYLIQNNLSESPCKFEIVSILKDGDEYKIDIIPLDL